MANDRVPPAAAARSAAIAGLLAIGLLFTPGIVSPAQATSPGVNGEIAYVRTPSGSRSDLFAMNANGSGNGRITNTPRVAEATPEWSPTGGSLAYQGVRNGFRRIFVWNASTGVRKRVSSGPFADRFPTWSPNGRRIAYRSLKTLARDGNLGSAHIYVVPRNGGTPTKLTSMAGINTDPAWSPDGSKIAFASNNDGNYDLYLMDADGTDVEQLTTDTGSVSNRFPGWSPDGSKIAYTSTREGHNEEIYVLEVATPSDPHLRLTNNLAIDRSPEWSPNGSAIAFASNRGGTFNIWTMKAADGSGPVRRTSGPARKTEPTWQPLVGCTIVGTNGSDVLVGTAARDVICSLGGSDSIRAGGGNDRVEAGPGTDQLRGGSGADTLRGGRGNDTLRLATGRDSSYGGLGADTLFAHDGVRDLVDGGPDRDRARVDGQLDVRRRVESRF